MKDNEMTSQNRFAWECDSYRGWVAGYGSPGQAAEKLMRNPTAKLKRILPHLGDPQGEKIANPLGSHGRVAVSLALLGAAVTVFDISSSNKQYAIELAASANVDINYVVGDFLQMAAEHHEQFDSIVMELGILHYFDDLDHFVRALLTLLKPGGKLVLHEYHPLLKKAMSVDDDGVALIGDYFKSTVERANTPYEIFLDNQNIPECLIRRWNLGEIVTGFVQNGFQLRKLIEEPAGNVAQLPGTFTLVALAA